MKSTDTRNMSQEELVDHVAKLENIVSIIEHAIVFNECDDDTITLSEVKRIMFLTPDRIYRMRMIGHCNNE